ncbi:hypothetical protein ABE83_07520 [Streptomyces sp. CFMR 7]|nr:hypothetical protein ABE83_07520 [Streptomyces sp. CFMR 7]RZF06959.1 hypothetical protein C0R05_18910 [Streptomyces albidoflavus]
MLREVLERAGRSRAEQARRLTAADRHYTEENVKRREVELRLPTPVWCPAIVSVCGLGEEQYEVRQARTPGFRTVEWVSVRGGPW